MKLLELENVGKRFFLKEAWVFRHLSFELHANQSIAFLGPSGGGKSLLLKLIAGLVQPSEGKIQRREGGLRIGMLFQRNALFDSMTVLQNLTFPLTEKMGLSHRKARLKAMELLEQVGLLSAARVYPNVLSGGMQKRLGLARALILEPELLLLDDPTAGLDPLTGQSITNLIKTLQKQKGSALLVASHEIQRVAELAEEVFLFSQARIIPCGFLSEIQKKIPPELSRFLKGLP